jgi:flagellar hook protein FlgE
MSSLFAALQVAVSGLNAQSSAIGNISDDLSNTNTIGYKGVDTKFESLVTESNATTNSPGGVKSYPYYTNSIEGDITSSNVDTSLAISGSGYFAVGQSVQDATGATSFTGTTYYTREGDFTLNAQGYLVNGSGYYLEGWGVTQSGTTTTVDSSKVAPIQISDLLDNPVATEKVDYAANLPSNAATDYTSAASTIVIYDSLGAQHTLSLSWSNTTVANEWTLTAACADAGVSQTYTVDFNTSGGTAAAGTLKDILDSGGNPETSAAISLTLPFTGAGSQTLSVNFGSFGSSTGLTQFSDSSSSPTVSVSSFDQDGIPRGSFQSLSIDDNGFLSINYDNGTNRVVDQIPVVTFFDEDKLQRSSGGVFTQTLTSGTARYTVAGTNGAGTIDPSSLESSNVDIATEFTNMIQAQRVYSANAKTVTTTDSMLQEVINIIR